MLQSSIGMVWKKNNKDPATDVYNSLPVIELKKVNPESFRVKDFKVMTTKRTETTAMVSTAKITTATNTTTTAKTTTTKNKSETETTTTTKAAQKPFLKIKNTQNKVSSRENNGKGKEKRLQIPQSLFKAFLPLIKYVLKNSRKAIEYNTTKQKKGNIFAVPVFPSPGNEFCREACYVCLDLFDFFCHECRLIEPDCNCC